MAALRNGFLAFAYTGHHLRLKFTGDFLARYPGAYLTFSHYEWRDGRFSTYKDREPITGPLVRFHLLPPGVHNFTVRSERGALLVSRPVPLVNGSTRFEGHPVLPSFETEIVIK